MLATFGAVCIIVGTIVLTVIVIEIANWFDDY